MSIDKSIIKHFVKTTERGAYGASLFRGKNDKIGADKAAVDEMRNQLNKIDIKGTIVIGEGEMDEAPMLYINEKVGTKKGQEFDIAVDPLEGTNFTSKNLPNALSVLAVSEKGNLLHAPDMYMEKIAIGKDLPKNLIDLDFGVKKNIKLLAEAKNMKANQLNACILNRPRHNGIIKALDLGSSLDGQEKRIKIMDNAKLMMSLLKDKINILDSESWIIPIMYYDEKITLKLSDFLQRNGMDAGMMSYPSVPHNQARIRLFVTSEHTKEQIREGSIILIKAAKAFNFLK